MMKSASSVLKATAIFLSASGSVLMAESNTNQPARPDLSDLRTYLTCNAMAEVRPLSFEEAAACSVAFERLKLSFVSNMSLNQFNGLPVAQRADLSVQGYKALRNWLELNSTEVQLLKQEVTRGQAFTMN